MYVHMYVYTSVYEYVCECARACACALHAYVYVYVHVYDAYTYVLKSLEIQTHVVHRDLHVRKYAYVHRACILDAHDLSTCMSYAPASDCQYASKHKYAFACTYMYAVCMDVCMSVCVRIYLKLCGSCRSKATSASESKIPRGCWGRWAKAGNMEHAAKTSAGGTLFRHMDGGLDYVGFRVASLGCRKSRFVQDLGV